MITITYRNVYSVLYLKEPTRLCYVVDRSFSAFSYVNHKKKEEVFDTSLQVWCKVVRRLYVWLNNLVGLYYCKLGW